MMKASNTPSTSAIETTIRVLEQSKSPTAQAVLIHALNVEDQQIRDTAARALLRAGSALGKTEIIRHIHRLSPDVITEVSHNEEALSFPLRQCLQHGDQESAQRALETIQSAHLYSEIPALLKYIGASSGLAADRAEQVLIAMVNRLYEQRLAQKPGINTPLTTQCEDLIQLLGSELSQFEKLKRPRSLIEALLILTDPTHAVARQLIRESSTDCQGVVWDLLMNSRHPGVLMFLFDSMNLKYIHPRILEIIGRRRDIEFQLTFIKNTPLSATVNQERNYCQLQSLPWLIPSEHLWKRVPEKWQGLIIRLVEMMSYKHEQRIAFYESALQFGSVEARTAAVKYRGFLKPQQFEKIIQDALESPDQRIEAWAVSELQNTSLPEKYRYLVNRLDSDNEAVQQQARESLGRFDLQNAIIFCESARPTVGPKIAELLLKINPNATSELVRELTNPVRSRRLRAAKATAIMNLQYAVIDALLEMLYDSDSIIKRTVAEILVDVPTPQVIAALTALLEDPSPRVRETAQATLDQMHQQRENQSQRDAVQAEAAELDNTEEGSPEEDNAGLDNREEEQDLPASAQEEEYESQTHSDIPAQETR